MYDPPDYKYLLSDTTSGKNICELPLTLNGPFTRVMNGVGTLQATMPLYDAAVTKANVFGDREITVVRNEIPIWNGPIVMLPMGMRSSNVMQVYAWEASAYLAERTLEVDTASLWTGATDIYTELRALITYMTSKTGAGGASINAPLPRFAVSPASATAGVTKTISYAGTDRRLFSDIINNDFVADQAHGVDYRMDYTTGSTRQTCQRTLTFGMPLGTARTSLLTEHVLLDWGLEADRQRAATRVHVLGNGYVSTQQNFGSVTAGETLLERVVARTDLSDKTTIDNYAKELRRLMQPPVLSYQVVFVPSDNLPYGWCDLGDTLTLAITEPDVLAISDTRRLVSISTMPPTSSAAEQVTLGFDIPLDRTGV